MAKAKATKTAPKAAKAAPKPKKAKTSVSAAKAVAAAEAVDGLRDCSSAHTRQCLPTESPSNP